MVGKKQSSNKLSYPGFLLAVVIFLSMGVYAASNLSILITDTRQIGRTQAVLSNLEDLHALLVEAELGQRNYILTGQENYLAPYRQATATQGGLNQHLQELRQLTADRPEQQERLDTLEPLITQKLDLLQQGIDRRRETGIDAAQAFIQAGQGQETMSAAHRLIVEMMDEENARLQRLSEGAAASLQNTLLVLAAGILLSLLLASFSFYATRREMRERRRAAEALRQLNDELELRVQQRTAELAEINQSLIASERNLRITLDTMLEGCQIISPDWRYLYINEAAASQGRLTPAELLGRTMMEAYPGIQDSPLFTVLRRCMSERTVQHMDNEFNYPDGSSGWFELSVRPVPEGIFILSIDITQRKRAEIRIGHLTRLYATLSQVNQTIVRVKDPDELFRAICQVAVEYGELGLAWVGLIDRPGEKLTPLASHGIAQEQLPFQTIAVKEAPFKDGLIGLAVRTGQNTYSQDIQTAATMQHWHAMAIAGGYHAAAAIPFHHNGVIVGMLNLYATDLEFFSDAEQQKLLEEMGLDISFALDTMELEAQHKQSVAALRQSEARYRQLFETNPHPMWVYDLETLRFLAVNDAAIHHYGYSHEEFLGMTIADIRPVEELPRLRASLATAPSGLEQSGTWTHLKKDGSAIDVEITSHPLDFDGRKAKLVLAHDVTLRKQAEEKAHLQLRHLAALSEIDRAIIASFGLTTSLRTVLSHICKELGVDAVSVLLFNPVLNTLKFAAGQGFRSRAIEYEPSPRIGASYAGQAVMERRMIHVADLAAQDDHPALQRLFQAENFISYYAIPLIAKGKVSGVLEVFHRSPLEPNEEWLDFLNMLAGQTAIAIDNATLFDGLERTNLELRLAYDATIEGWSRAMDLRDEETEGHTQRVTDLTLRLARAAGIDEQEIAHVKRGALLHDIGKLGVPDAILLKPGRLTAEEWIIMRRHPQSAYDMLVPITYLRPALDIPYCHHEKWDGNGYPRGLKGEQIPLPARLFAVVDVWDALRSDRPYRTSWPAAKVLDHIRSLSGTHFDPRAVDLFMQLISEDEQEIY